MSSNSTFKSFGVPIEGTSLTETVERAVNGRARWIVTANPEILLEARRDPSYRDILNKADLRIADGIGLTMIAALKGHHLTRVTGVELAEKILDESGARGWTVAFIGGGKGIAQQAFDAQKKRLSSLKGLVFDGGNVSTDGTGDDVNEEIIQQLIQTAPDVLFVAFGHPKQEKWVAKQLPSLPSVKIAMGIGGTFDYWSGTVRRAPSWMRSIGLEWLFRLFIEPKRWKRIVNAVVIYPILSLIDRS
jgi:N-acetylglucosaminyldiphosphoundecaprenol N-acetyl-beta-D-mannosaminyltransferase